MLIALGLAGFVAYQLLSGPPGTAQVAIPAVIGLTEREARDQLAAVGLRPGTVQQVPSDVGEVGRVTATDPPVGQQVGEQSTVDLSVGGGPTPAPGQITVPQLVGLSVDEARAELGKVGLTAGAQTEAEAAADQALERSSRPNPDRAPRSTAGARSIS